MVKTSQSLSLTSSFNDFLGRSRLLLWTTSVAGFGYHLKTDILKEFKILFWNFDYYNIHMTQFLLQLISIENQLGLKCR